MSITKFLLIDVALAIAATPILFLLQRKNYPVKSSIKSPPYKLPKKENLLELEKLAILQGSGIKCNSLIGEWKFISIWEKDNDYKDSVFSSLLRVFSATIEFKENFSTENSNNLFIKTSIQFGIISIEFSGCAYLKGKQPLLSFFFDLIELKSGSKILLRRSLNEPPNKKKPFFSLIAFKGKEGWLSARGQRGGLVLWKKIEFISNRN